MTQSLLAYKANAAIACAGGNYPVHYAAQLAASDDMQERAAGYALMQMLMSEGSGLHLENAAKQTPLAICHAQDQLVELAKSIDINEVRVFLHLAKSIVNINHCDAAGWTALCIAARYGHAENG
jgi:ankyrin repeat protein